MPGRTRRRVRVGSGYFKSLQVHTSVSVPTATVYLYHMSAPVIEYLNHSSHRHDKIPAP